MKKKEHLMIACVFKIRYHLNLEYIYKHVRKKNIYILLFKVKFNLS